LQHLGREGISERPSLESLRSFVHWPIIIATHSLKYYEIISFRARTHLIFAVTPASGYG